MTDPLYVPGDALPAVRDHLAATVPGYTAGVRVATDLSPRWTPTTSPPELIVFDDSGPMRWPVESLQQIRCTVWAGDRPTASMIARFALGTLLCHRVPGIAKVLPGAAPLDARDDRNGGHMCSFTVVCRVRTVPA